LKIQGKGGKEKPDHLRQRKREKENKKGNNDQTRILMTDMQSELQSNEKLIYKKAHL
jgi:hypothetical protein